LEFNTKNKIIFLTKKNLTLAYKLKISMRFHVLTRIEGSILVSTSLARR